MWRLARLIRKIVKRSLCGGCPSGEHESYQRAGAAARIAVAIREKREGEAASKKENETEGDDEVPLVTASEIPADHIEEGEEFAEVEMHGKEIV